MKITCGNLNISSRYLKVLQELGREIHAGRQPFVFDGGIVGQNDGQKGKVSNGSQAHTGNRSEARSRQGQRAWTWSGTPCEAESCRSGAVEKAYGAEFRILARHYEALGFEDRNGLWVVAKSEPLGNGGPSAHFLVAFPKDKAIYPRAWAFLKIGPKAELYPLKHTNFPDASICAFTKSSRAWVAEDGMLALMDHYSLWALKSLHRAALGWWPGPQVGICALYRKNEFTPNELCGCESGLQYGLCHQARDMSVAENRARAEFRHYFRGEYEDRAAPNSIMLAARNRWKSMPDMATVFALRPASDEPTIPLLS